MNAESFYEYLENPSKLYQISHQELKSLMIQYPYSPNIRYLILAKSMLDKKKDVERNLELAALHSPDRGWLRRKYEQMEALVAFGGDFQTQEDFLELRDLAEWQQETVIIQETTGTRAAELQQELASELSGKSGKPGEPIFALLHESEVEDSGSSQTDTRDFNTDAVIYENEEPYFSKILTVVVKNAAVVQGVAANLSKPESKKGDAVQYSDDADSDESTPDPKSNFNSWLKQFQPPQLEVPSRDLKDVIQNAPPSPEYLPPEDVAKDLASRSISEDSDIISLSLAALLEGQGHYEKAITMYEKLSLFYPEKSTFFAAKIEKLKNK